MEETKFHLIVFFFPPEKKKYGNNSYHYHVYKLVIREVEPDSLSP